MAKTAFLQIEVALHTMTSANVTYAAYYKARLSEAGKVLDALKVP